MWANITKIRSHWATAARKAVSNLYGLRASDGAPDQIKTKVENLINDWRFMATVRDNPGGQPAIAYFNSPPLWKFLEDILIQYPKSIARHPAVRDKYFRRLRPCTIFLACTVLQCALQAYTITGVQLSPPPMFETGEYSALHRFMGATWEKVFRTFISKTASSPGPSISGSWRFSARLSRSAMHPVVPGSAWCTQLHPAAPSALQVHPAAPSALQVHQAHLATSIIILH